MSLITLALRQIYDLFVELVTADMTINKSSNIGNIHNLSNTVSSSIIEKMTSEWLMSAVCGKNEENHAVLSRVLANLKSDINRGCQQPDRDGSKPLVSTVFACLLYSILHST